MIKEILLIIYVISCFVNLYDFLVYAKKCVKINQNILFEDICITFFLTFVPVINAVAALYIVYLYIRDFLEENADGYINAFFRRLFKGGLK